MDGWIRIGTEIDTKNFDAQIDYIENQLEDIEHKLQQADMGFEVGDVSKLEAQYEKLSNKLSSLKQKQTDLNNTDLSNLQTQVNKTGEDISKNVKKGEKSLKRFALSLFSIRSIYTLVSKASSSYLSQDTELAKKLQSVWNGLGSFLAPLIEWISNVLLKGIGYLNEFMKALTGIDFVANANAKALKNQANAQKSLNKQTTSFDEMNKVSSSNSSSNSTSGLINIPELDQGIITKLQEMAKWLKENWDWLSKLLITFGIVFGIAKISGWVKNIGKLIGSASAGTGLLGLNGILGTIAQIGVIAIGVDLVYTSITGRDLVQDLKDIYTETKKLKDANKEIVEANKKVTSTTKEVINKKNEEAKNWEKGSQEVAQYTAYLNEAITSAGSNIKKTIEWSENLSLFELIMAQITGDMEKNTTKANENANQIDLMMESYKNLYEQGLLTEEQMENYNKLLEAQQTGTEQLNRVIHIEKSKYASLSDALEEAEFSGQKAKSAIDEVKTTINDLTNKNHNIKIDTEFTTPDTSALKALQASVGVGSAIGLAISKIKLKTGGIVNNPGHGVPIGTNAIGGETGREGVIPLTDSQAMEELGSTIGRYITINATMVNQMNGRTISRELMKIQNESAFATNR